ncbi:ubiquinone biosynthesis mono0xygenase COQ6 [Xylona heveae TC161]|uniref:Ubiquinone biosynthesis monooxygenase COQ6, mitochondrial n=1 Tax=Xylona heveae (strain CBS 132557 / TC161) TaxID=1328760 RepID=A0A165AE09_XYLHT|nr:ubiquinone biosynthesis mono0xygenase COQ6 [Xylona heveae TC161]KZF20322.1 ubiquinone biosynthesis mono0xygenase COQ6 [Xylona heveae TC161]
MRTIRPASSLASVSLRPRPRTTFICHACIRSLGKRYASTSAPTGSAIEAPEIYDVVCVGGGPAGLSLLSALRSSKVTSGLKVALVEGQDLSRTRTWQLPRDQFSNRVSSLTPASVGFLKDIGAWKHIDTARVQAYDEMQVWDGITGSNISFDWPTGSTSKTIAYMCENLNLTRGLLAHLDELGGFTLLDNSRVEKIETGEEYSFSSADNSLNLTGWPIVQLSSGKQLAARLLVGADGANSPVRTFAGIESRGWDYERHGVVATISLEGLELDLSDFSNTVPGGAGKATRTAYQRFLPTGPVALLPMPGPFATLVWSTLPSHAALLKSLSPTDFVAMVNAAFRLSHVDLAYLHTLSSGQLEEVSWREKHTAFDVAKIPARATGVQDGTVQSFPLRMRNADTYTGERVALVGDAAHTTHPLAGQGLNQGQLDIQSLARTITYAVEHGQDIGAQLSLESYNAERYAANNLMLGVVDKIHKLYATSFAPVVALRSLGLGAVNQLGPLKRFFMEQAAGTGKRL